MNHVLILLLIVSFSAHSTDTDTTVLPVTDSGAHAIHHSFFQSQLSAFISKAIENNPDIQSFENKILSAQSSAAAKRVIDPPSIEVAFMKAPLSSFPNPLKDQMEIDFSVQQMFPYPGKLASMSKADNIKAALYEQEKQVKKLDISYSLKKAYIEHYYLCRQQETIEENYILIKKLAEITSKQYEQGTGKQADILRAQSELSTITKQRLSTKADLMSAEAMMNSLINQPIESPLTLIAEIEPETLSFTYTQLVPLALKHRPELTAMDQDIRMQQAELYASAIEAYPDFMINCGYKRAEMPPVNNWGIMIGMTLPMMPWTLKKNKAMQNSITYTVKQRYKEIENMRLMISAQVKDALVKIENYQTQVALYKSTIIAQAHATLQSTQAAYQSGNTEFLMLIDASRMLVMAKQDYQMSVMNLLMNRALLERVIGLDINHIRTALTIEGTK